MSVINSPEISPRDVKERRQLSFDEKTDMRRMMTDFCSYLEDYLQRANMAIDERWLCISDYKKERYQFPDSYRIQMTIELMPLKWHMCSCLSDYSDDDVKKWAVYEKSTSKTPNEVGTELVRRVCMNHVEGACYHSKSTTTVRASDARAADIRAGMNRFKEQVGWKQTEIHCMKILRDYWIYCHEFIKSRTEARKAAVNDEVIEKNASPPTVTIRQLQQDKNMLTAASPKLSKPESLQRPDLSPGDDEKIKKPVPSAPKQKVKSKSSKKNKHKPQNRRQNR